MEVRDLFFNTPARRKFLRAEKTETSHIVQAVSNLALAWPQIRFDLQSGDRQVFALEPAGDAAERLQQLESALGPGRHSDRGAGRGPHGPGLPVAADGAAAAPLRGCCCS